MKGEIVKRALEFDPDIKSRKVAEELSKEFPGYTAETLIRYVQQARKAGVKVQRALIISDVHVPFHHKKGWKHLISMTEDTRFDFCCVNGDFLDCLSISRFPKPPGSPGMALELREGKALLSELSLALGDNCERHWLDGNHEQRWDRFIYENPGLYKAPGMSISEMMGLAESGWSYSKYMKPVMIHDLTVVHGNKVSKHAGYSAKATLIDGGFKNVVVGHTHRQGCFKHTGAMGTRAAWEIGGLYDKEQADYVNNPNWQPGFGVAYFADGEFVDLTLIAMRDDGGFVFEGSLYC